jgi:hypothetical protein
MPGQNFIAANFGLGLEAESSTRRARVFADGFRVGLAFGDVNTPDKGTDRGAAFSFISLRRVMGRLRTTSMTEAGELICDKARTRLTWDLVKPDNGK